MYLLIGTIIFIIDLLIKNHIEKLPESKAKQSFANGKLFLERYHNKGGALDCFSNHPTFFKVISNSFFLMSVVYLLYLLPKKGHRMLKTGMALLTSGAASNQYDRWERGYVVDYLKFGVKWKWLRRIVFNLSDFCIFFGAILTVMARVIKSDKK